MPYPLRVVKPIIPTKMIFQSPIRIVKLIIPNNHISPTGFKTIHPVGKRYAFCPMGCPIFLNLWGQGMPCPFALFHTGSNHIKDYIHPLSNSSDCYQYILSHYNMHQHPELFHHKIPFAMQTYIPFFSNVL